MDNLRRSQIDLNDAAHVAERTLRPILECIPAPVVEGKINPHVSRFYLGKTEDGQHEYSDLFHVKPVYYETIHGAWRPMSEVASFYGNKRIVLRDGWADSMHLRYLAWLLKRMELLGGSVSIPSPLKFEQLIPLSEYQRAGHATIHFATLTAYPDPHPETTTCDGWAWHSQESTGWSTVRNGSGNSSGDSGTGLPAMSYNSGGGGFRLMRSMTGFDTSSIADTASVSAGVYSLYWDNTTDQDPHDNDDNDGDDFVSVLKPAPASNTAIASGDYDSFLGLTGAMTEGCDSGQRRDFGTILSGGEVYNDWTLNATGRGWINLTGVTWLGIAEGHDIIDSSIVVSGGTGNRTNFRSAENTAGTTSDPKLVVTYTTSTAYTTTLTESVTLVDTVLKQPGKMLTDSVTLVDTLIKKPTRVLTDTIMLVDTVLKNTTMRVLSETITLVDTFTSVKVLSTTLEEVVTLVDTFIRNASRTLSESITLVDTFTRQWVLYRVMEETVTLTDTVVKMASKVMTETVTLTDTIVKGATKVLTETVTLVDTILRRMERTLSDSVTLVDTIVTQVFKSLVLTDRVTLVATFIAGFLNYVKKLPFISGTRDDSAQPGTRRDDGIMGSMDDGGQTGTRY